MKRIFPDVIEVYKQFGSSNPLDEFLEDKIYQEYVNRLPTIQEYFCRVSNKKAIEAGVMMGTDNESLDLPSHQLHLSAAACGYNMENHHHALCDAEACAAIALKIL